MIDMIYFLVCLLGYTFFSMFIGWMVGYKDGKTKRTEKRKEVIKIDFGRKNF